MFHLQNQLCISVTVVISLAACYFVDPDSVKHDANNVYGIMAEYGREGVGRGGEKRNVEEHEGGKREEGGGINGGRGRGD